MAVTLADCRFYCNDAPVVYPPSSVSPEVIGTGDGTLTQFFVSYPNLIVGSIVVWFGTLVTQGTEQVQQLVGQPSTAYAVSGQMVTFSAAPPVGVTVFARYAATAFADVDLRGILRRATAAYGAMGDTAVLKACYYDVLDILVIDIDRLRLVRYGDFMTDAKHLVQTLDRIKSNIRMDLRGEVRPGSAAPVFARTQGTYRSFNGRR